MFYLCHTAWRYNTILQKIYIHYMSRFILYVRLRYKLLHTCYALLYPSPYLISVLISLFCINFNSFESVISTAPSSSPLSVRAPDWTHIPECLRGAGGRRRPGPSRWCGCRRRWIWSTRRSSRSQRWSRASRGQLVVRHTALKDTQEAT